MTSGSMSGRNLQQPVPFLLFGFKKTKPPVDNNYVVNLLLGKPWKAWIRYHFSHFLYHSLRRHRVSFLPTKPSLRRESFACEPDVVAGIKRRVVLSQSSRSGTGLAPPYAGVINPQPRPRWTTAKSYFGQQNRNPLMGKTLKSQTPDYRLEWDDVSEKGALLGGRGLYFQAISTVGWSKTFIFH